MAETELSIVCKSCGSEVSPYVTECPYCGTRLRKRAPKLERRGDGLEAQESRRDRRRRRAAERRERRERLRGLSLTTERPYVTLAFILAPAALLIVQRGADLSLSDLGVVIGPPAANSWWNYLSAPFVYDDIGYLFAIGVAIALFVPGLERRLGAVPTLLLLVACGALGALAAPGIDDAFGDGLTLAAGGNGIALGALGAWFMVRRADAREDPTEELDTIPVVVAAMVLLALPLVNDYANEWSGIVGGLVGLAAGFSATLGRRP
ncbi:MAG TPA: zinc ribbon domain-containing protein [Solirubrobacterales bacterium]|nr:zinc ribbon domain-containing protein [Solirubrobacterales bacterium]